MSDQPSVEERFNRLIAALVGRDGVALGSYENLLSLAQEARAFVSD